jgi:hypothetical protein
MGYFKKTFFVGLLGAVLFVATPTQEARAVPLIAEIIREGVIWVIKAVNLMIQRLQNETLWLQNAAKVVENKLHQLKLTEIADWTEKHRALYQKYYDELWQIRSTLATYHRIALVVRRQEQIVEQYRFTWAMVSQDGHFTSSEVDYMYQVYTGILKESVYNVEQVLMVINSYRMQMSDAKRLEIINTAAEGIEKNYTDLQQFNNQNIQLSINRAKDKNEVDIIKKLYGIR